MPGCDAIESIDINPFVVLPRGVDRQSCDRVGQRVLVGRGMAAQTGEQVVAVPCVVVAGQGIDRQEQAGEPIKNVFQNVAFGFALRAGVRSGPGGRSAS